MEISHSDRQYVAELKPPPLERGIVGWAKENLFNGVFNSILTVIILGFLVKVIPELIDWALFKAAFFTTGKECHATDGACWSVVTQNIRFIIFGFLPPELQWRPLTSMILLFVLLFFTYYRKFWCKQLVYAWFAGLVIITVLMTGGFLGLERITTMEWGGLPLTLLLTLFGCTAAYPLGVVLALGRQSSMPFVKYLCIIYIELIRGVPLISLLFMATIIFPLFLPEGVTINKILRAQAAIIFFWAAYIAEVVRGGLQGMPKGQYEAADSMGLNYYLTMRLIILPQALKMVIPPTVGILVTAFKDTSLVVIIALYDILKTSQSVVSKPEWMGFSSEVYLFLAILYFIGCFSMSSFSRKLEKDLDTGDIY